MRAAGAAKALDAAVAEGIAANDIETHRLRGARRGPVFIADVEADTVGPLERVVLKDEVVAAVGGDQAALRNRKSVARVHKRDAFHADVGLVALGGREHLLVRRDLDDVVGGVVVVGQAYVQRHVRWAQSRPCRLRAGTP